MRVRHLLIFAVLAAATGCRHGDVVADGEVIPWLTAVAEAALDSRQTHDDASALPSVNVAAATGLEHHLGALSLVRGAVDRDQRPQYVSALWSDGTPRVPLSEIPVEEPPPVLYGEPGWDARVRMAEYDIVGPYTLALDAVEIDTETRKVAVFTVFAKKLPWGHPDGHVLRDAGAVQYRVEGLWDGWRWVTRIVDTGHGTLWEYRHPGTHARLDGLHTPDWIGAK